MRPGCRCVGLVLVLVVALVGCDPERVDRVELPDPVPGVVVGAVVRTSDIAGEQPSLLPWSVVV
jgi:hypothetical protein